MSSNVVSYLMQLKMMLRLLGADPLVPTLVCLTLALLPGVLECIEVFVQTPESHHPEQDSRTVHGVDVRERASHDLH